MNKGVLTVGFIDEIKEKARQNRKTIVLPEAEDIRTLQAALGLDSDSDHSQQR